MEPITIPVSRRPGTEDLPLPAYQTAGSSGMDLMAAVEDPIEIAPGDIRAIPTGLFLALPTGYEGQVRPRSGLALRHGITLVNSPGTIDSDYRGELAVLVGNLGRCPFTVTRGLRIAQLVIAPVTIARWQPTDRLDDTPRGSGGFGHTGV